MWHGAQHGLDGGGQAERRNALRILLRSLYTVFTPLFSKTRPGRAAKNYLGTLAGSWTELPELAKLGIQALGHLTALHAPYRQAPLLPVATQRARRKERLGMTGATGASARICCSQLCAKGMEASSLSCCCCALHLPWRPHYQD